MTSAAAARLARLAGHALLAGALFFGGILRLASARVGDGADGFWNDEWEYYGIGAQLAETGQFRPYPGWIPTAFRMPLYPSAISVVRRAAPGISALRVAQALADECAVAAVYAAASLLGGGLAGGAAAAFYAFFDPAIEQVRFPRIETFFGLLTILALCAWIDAARRKGGNRVLCAAALLGIALSCRSTLFLLPPFLALLPEARGWKARLKTLAVAVLGGYLLLLPWTLRNAALFGAFIPFENGAVSLNLWGASVGLLENPKIPELMRSAEHRGFLAQAQKASDLERPRVFLQESLRNIRRRPLPFILNAFRRLPMLWREQWPLILLALPLLLRRRMPKGTGVVFLLIAGFSLHAVMGVTPRYARPAAGTVCVAAGVGLLLALRLTGVALGRGRGRRRVVPFGRARAWGWPGEAAKAAAAAAACVWLVCAAQLLGEAWHRRGRAHLPSEYLSSPDRYASLKRANSLAVDFAFRGGLPEAEIALSELLQREPGFGEALLNRALLRRLTGDRNGAARDYREMLSRLEFPRGAADPVLMARLSQF
ncbi:MAG: glycosyltransferase family 39 protein [Elusimicrobia bacterium]|nr:glycosyltransferase family 39 protein [Elusimicrobiota bacterium]